MPRTTKASMPAELVDEDIETEEPVEEVTEELAEEEESEEPIMVEDLDPKEELWPGGPTAGEVAEWKEEYGSVYLTSVTLDDHILWRPLSRPEYKAHVRNMESLVDSGQMSPADANLYNEEAIAATCILYPPYDPQNKNELAGLASLISQEVLEASGFVALEVRQL